MNRSTSWARFIRSRHPVKARKPQYDKFGSFRVRESTIRIRSNYGKSAHAVSVPHNLDIWQVAKIGIVPLSVETFLAVIAQ